MSRKAVTVCSLVLTFLLILSYGVTINKNGLDCDLWGFLEKCIDNSQKLIFNGMIYILPVIYASCLQFAAPEYLIRARKDLLWRLTKRMAAVSAAMAAYVLGMLMAVSASMGFGIGFQAELINIYFKILIFFLECYCLFYFIYALCLNSLLSLGAVFGINMVFLIILLWTDFSGITQTDMMEITIIFSVIVCVLAYIVLAAVIKKKEFLLKNDV